MFFYFFGAGGKFLETKIVQSEQLCAKVEEKKGR